MLYLGRAYCRCPTRLGICYSAHRYNPKTVFFAHSCVHSSSHIPGRLDVDPQQVLGIYRSAHRYVTEAISSVHSLIHIKHSVIHLHLFQACFLHMINMFWASSTVLTGSVPRLHHSFIHHAFIHHQMFQACILHMINRFWASTSVLTCTVPRLCHLCIHHAFIYCRLLYASVQRRWSTGFGHQLQCS